MSDIELNNNWNDWDKEYDFRVLHLDNQLRNEESVSKMFYNLLDATTTLNMSFDAPDSHTALMRKEALGMLYRACPQVEGFPNMHRNANTTWSILPGNGGRARYRKEEEKNELYVYDEKLEKLGQTSQFWLKNNLQRT